MATRRRVGFSTSTSEASRRQLMQPVPCWEKVWAPPDAAPPGSTLRVFKWVKTEKVQQFSDDEGEADEPLAPIQPEDLVEVVDGDDEDADEGAGSQAPDAPTPGALSRDVSEPASAVGGNELSKPATPQPGAHKPHPLSVSFQPPTPPSMPEEEVDEGLAEADALTARPPPDGDEGEDGGVDLGDGMSLDLGDVGPDGAGFEGDLSQMQADDALLGGPMLDDEMGDPFAVPPS
ncbi:uncharacterized protein BXZ73DRAFT_78418 [Epithele typhae]|uniref:uncharacterized protein n=1 Tax=Epithele typhae TaxID=378194 RepID=UPI0020074967|nr:uncharacterized protein BXZ73DRAFT_78418 [Epithele typhae]KAH9927966.1 hypothetical protein BXZ73DRAFT_78418 [Epithele typhae]